MSSDNSKDSGKRKIHVKRDDIHDSESENVETRSDDTARETDDITEIIGETESSDAKVFLTKDEQIAELEQEVERLLDNLKRERAAFINYRQREEEEKSQVRMYAAQDLAFDLLNVLDYFEASMQFTGEEETQSVIQGVKYTIEEMKRILARHHVKEVPTDIPFDPRFHEAFDVEMTDKEKPDTILKVHRKGYVMRDRVLRPAMVTIAKMPDDDETCGSQSGIA